MIIAVSANGATLDATIDNRFGRCPWFVFVDSDDMSFEGVANLNATLGSGAGIQAARLVAEHGSTAVLTGNCGPNAVQTLKAANIDVFLGCQGSVHDAVEQFKNGDLSPADGPNVPGHTGTGKRGMGRAGGH